MVTVPTFNGLPITKDPYRSNLERKYAGQLQYQKLAGLILDWKYEPVTFRLPGRTRYTPDFWVHFKDGCMAFVEVKGWSRSLPRSRMAWKQAADLWPFFRWQWATKRHGAWQIETYKGA